MNESEFWNYITKKSDIECWDWLGAKTKKIGILRFNGISMTSVRAMWIITYGTIPTNHRIQHICKNKQCVNPNHLVLSKTLSERIHSKIIEKSKTECWEYVGYKDRDGYGHSRNGHKDILAHRFIYQEFYGVHPKNLCTLHKCDNPSCCNPYHLFLGTTQDNTKDMVNKKRHSYGIKNGNHKLNEAQVLEIRNKHQEGVSLDSLANSYNVTRTNIKHIILGNTWSFLSDIKID